MSNKNMGASQGKEVGGALTFQDNSIIGMTTFFFLFFRNYKQVQLRDKKDDKIGLKKSNVKGFLLKPSMTP